MTRKELSSKIVQQLIDFSELCPTQISALLGITSMDKIYDALRALYEKGIAAPSQTFHERITPDEPMTSTSDKYGSSNDVIGKYSSWRLTLSRIKTI